MNEILKKRIEEAANDYVHRKIIGMSEDFVNGAEYALTHQWISVEEALPPLLMRVLVKSEKTKKTGITYRYQNPGEQPKWMNYEYVTWWMPIPCLK